MKIYNSEFNLSQPSDKQIWVKPYSDIAIGVKVIDKDGNSVAKSRITLKDGSTTMTAESSLVGGNVIYKVSTAEPTTKVYGVYVDNKMKFKLTSTVKDVTVYEKDEVGSTYTLPVASSSRLGGIKVGQNLTITSDGTLNASGGSATPRHTYVEIDDSSEYQTTVDASTYCSICIYANIMQSPRHVIIDMSNVPLNSVVYVTTFTGSQFQQGQLAIDFRASQNPYSYEILYKDNDGNVQIVSSIAVPASTNLRATKIVPCTQLTTGEELAFVETLSQGVQ